MSRVPGSFSAAIRRRQPVMTQHATTRSRRGRLKRRPFDQHRGNRRVALTSFAAPLGPERDRDRDFNAVGERGDPDLHRGAASDRPLLDFLLPQSGAGLELGWLLSGNAVVVGPFGPVRDLEGRSAGRRRRDPRDRPELVRRPRPAGTHRGLSDWR